MSDVEGSVSAALELLRSSPNAEGTQSCVSAALLSWLEVSSMHGVLPLKIPTRRPLTSDQHMRWAYTPML
jgi:hypothetical protein